MILIKLAIPRRRRINTTIIVVESNIPLRVLANAIENVKVREAKIKSKNTGIAPFDWGSTKNKKPAVTIHNPNIMPTVGR